MTNQSLNSTIALAARILTFVVLSVASFTNPLINWSNRVTSTFKASVAIQRYTCQPIKESDSKNVVSILEIRV